MGFEDDPVFRNPRLPEAREAAKRPYHLMSPEERRQAWADVREAQKRRSKRISRTPLAFGSICVLLILAATIAIHFRSGTWAGILLWAAVAFAAFALIAFVKGIFQGLPWKDDDMPDPPGF